MTALADGVAYLTAQSGASLLALFWFTILFELPKYGLSFLSVVAGAVRRDPAIEAVAERIAADSVGRVSVVVAGHNEEDAIARCVAGLHEQSRVPDEIVVVSDGSNDAMPARLRELMARNLVDGVHCTSLRAGKAAAVNLAERLSSGDIIVNLDVDCTFDRDAIRNIVAPFADRRIGGVSGNILVRNAAASLVAAFQAIEYLISISLGKRSAELVNHVVCVSGGFGAFRRAALEQVSGFDVGGGEDLDATLRLRKAGWQIRFAADAICYTDVPATMRGFIHQRFRWERDAVRLRYRKHGDLVLPFSSRRLSPTELAHELEFTLFNVAAAFAFPIYVVWLAVTYGQLALPVLLAAQAGLMALDLVSFLLAAAITPRSRAMRLLPYLLGYGLFQSIVMRVLRIIAYLHEWLFIGSFKDPYVPEKVRIMRKW